MGIETVAICSKSDKNAMYLKQAAIPVCIGPSDAEGSYLNIPDIIRAAEITDIEAIHPGYGFLSEVSHFAEVCESSKIVFIGPKAEVLKKLGNKTEARKIAVACKVPVVPGSESIIKSQQQALDVAHKIVYPLIIKASSGGGGRGMRVAHNDISLVNSLAVARREAESAFKDPSIYIEKYIEDTRHVEVQIFGDNYGNIIHLGKGTVPCSENIKNLFAMPQLVQKFYAIRDEKAIRRGMAASTAFALLIAATAYFTGAASRLFLSAENAPGAFAGGKPVFDVLMPEFLAKVVPPTLSILMMLLILSASMSSLAALALISSSSVVKDLYAGFVNPGVADKTLTRLMRVMSAVFVLLSVVLAYLRPSTIVAILSVSWGAIGSFFLGPFDWGLISRRATKFGANGSGLLGLGTCLELALAGVSPAEAGTIGMLVSSSARVTPNARDCSRSRAGQTASLRPCLGWRTSSK